MKLFFYILAIWLAISSEVSSLTFPASQEILYESKHQDKRQTGAVPLSNVFGNILANSRRVNPPEYYPRYGYPTAASVKPPEQEQSS